MKRLIALLAALCCLAALLTPVWAVQDEGTGADSGETGAAASDTADAAGDSGRVGGGRRGRDRFRGIGLGDRPGSRPGGRR